MDWLMNLCLVCTLYIVKGNEFWIDNDVTPTHYDLKLIYDIDLATNFSYFGVVDIRLRPNIPTKTIVLHAETFDVYKEKIKVTIVGQDTHAVMEVANGVQGNGELRLELLQEMQVNVVYSVVVPFDGNLRSEHETPYGGVVYKSYVDKTSLTTEYYVMSEFEISARPGFPCFDKMSTRSTFSVSIGHHKDYHSFSSMPLHGQSNSNPIERYWPMDVIESRFRKGKDDYLWDHFDATVMMHIHSLAFLVSKFHRVTSQRKVKRALETEINVWVRPDVVDQAKFAASIAPQVLAFYEDTFKVSYSLPKLDLVATPNLMAFAMVEFVGSWGLIQSRESHLLSYEPNDNNFITYMVSLKMARQWIGHLVSPNSLQAFTMSVGCNLFLAELATKQLSAPASVDTFFMQQVTKVLDADASEYSQPISQWTHDPKHEYTELDDFFYYDVSHDKSAILMRMLYHALGETTFKEAIQGYILNKAYKNTEIDELWEKMNEAGRKYQTFPDRTTVKEVMETWTQQPGYPLLTVKRDYGTRTLTITQRRYFTLEHKRFTGNISRRFLTPSWWIPLRVAIEKDEKIDAAPSVYWLTDAEGTSAPHKFQHAAPSDEWLLLNSEMIVLCRINYDMHNWRLLADSLKIGDYKNIPTMSRCQLLSDGFALAMTGNLPYTIPLSLASYLYRETDHRPWSSGLEGLHTIEVLLQHTPHYDRFMQYVRSIVEEPYNAAQGLRGMVDQGSKDYNDLKMQKYLSRAACHVSVEDCEETAVKMFEELMYTENPDENNNIPVHLRGTVYCAAVSRGAAAHWRFMLELARRDTSPAAADALAALACTRLSWLILKTLEIAVNEEFEVHGSADILFEQVLRSPLGFYIGKEFIYKRLAELDRYNYKKKNYLIKLMVEHFTVKHELDEYYVWRSKHESQFIELDDERAIRKARKNIAWINDKMQLVIDELTRHGSRRSQIDAPRKSLKSITSFRSKCAKTVFSKVLFSILLLVQMV